MRASQLVPEPLLLERLRSYACVEMRQGWQVTGLQQDSAAVSVEAKAVSGEPAASRIAARYVAGCDGGRSFVRHSANLRYGGEGGLELDFMGRRMIATYFRPPDLLDAIRQAPAWQYWSLNPQGRALLVAIDGRRDF